MLQFNSTPPAQPSPLMQPDGFMAAAAKQPAPNKKKLFGFDKKPALAIVALVLLAGLSSLAIFISERQRLMGNRPVTPNAPESQPQASVVKVDSCALTFRIKAECNARCATTADCQAENPDWECVAEASPTGPITAPVMRCRLISNPTSETCLPPVISITPSPTPIDATPTPTLPPDVTPTLTPVPPTPTDGPTPTNEPTPINTPTIPPGITVNPTTPGTTTTYTVVTTYNCNDVCSRNSDCSNPSHICSNGRCRLDANPDDAMCRLPSGQTSIVVNTIPTQPPAPKVLIQAGPADWGNYLKVGFGALGAGALLLLFL